MLVVNADAAALSVLLDAARRHLGSDARVTFPPLATTRRGLHGGSEIVLNRREFAQIARAEGFLAMWQAGDAMTALLATARADLEAGTSVVIGVPHEHIRDSHDIERSPWPHTRIVRLTVHTELARGPLTPRACLARMLGPRNPAFARAHRTPERFDARVHVGGSIGAAIGRIADAIAGVVAPVA